MRQQTLCKLAKQYKTVDEAEEALGLTVDKYLEGEDTGLNIPASVTSEVWKHLTGSQCKQVLNDIIKKTQLSDKIILIENVLQEIKEEKDILFQLFSPVFRHMPLEQCEILANNLFAHLAKQSGIDSNPADFISLSLKGMKRLKGREKNNILYKFSECLGRDRPGTTLPLMPLDRMPFGLIEYQIEFFSSSHITQVLFGIS